MVKYLADNSYTSFKRTGNEIIINGSISQEIRGINKRLAEEIRKGGVTIVFPASTQRIGSETFSNLNIEGIIFPKSLYSIGEAAFSRCSNLKRIDFSSGLVEIGARAFSQCNSLEIIRFPSNFVGIATSAFFGCRKLTSVQFNDKLVRIGDGSFSNCHSLGRVDIPDSVTFIGNGAFYGCIGLVEATLGEGVKELRERVFSGCSKLEQVKLSDKLDLIADEAFMNCENLDNVVLPDGLSYIGNGAFYGCKSLKKIVIPQNVNSIGKTIWNSNKEVFGPFEDCSSLESVIIDSKIETLEKDTFKNCTSLKEVKLPDTLTYIQGYAFENCSSLDTILLSDSLKWIGRGSFKGCTGLVSVTFPQNLESIGRESFLGATSLTDIVVPSSVKKIKMFAFKDCTNLKSITLQEGLITIAEGAFAGLTSLTEITIPSSVISMGDNVFNGCTSLRNIGLSNELVVIGSGVFEGCTSLSKVTLPTGIVLIAGGAFKNCNRLKSISFPDNLTKIEREAFCNCNTLAKVFIPDQVSELGTSAFSGCKNLRKVRLPKNINHYGSEVFKDCPLNDLTIYTNNGKKILSSILGDISKEYVNYIDKFRLNIIYDNYKDLVEFLDSSYEFLCNNYYTKNFKLKINLVGVELSRWQKFRLNGKYPEIMSIVSLKSLEAFDIIEKESWKEDEIYISPKIIYYRDGVKASLLEMETNIKDLPDEIKELFYDERDRMIQKYEESISVSDISFSEDEKEINLFEKTRDSLVQDLLTGLDKLKKKSNSSMISKYIEITRCIDLLDTVVENQPDNSDSVEELVGHIVYFITKFNKDKRDEFIEQTKSILLEKKSLFLDGVTKTITDDESFNSVDEVIWGIELEKSIREVLSSVLVYKTKVDPYLEVLDALQQEEVKSHGSGDSLSAMIISLKYSISFVSDANEKKSFEDGTCAFCNKYIKRIEGMLNDFDNIKDDDFEKLEIEMRESIHPILKKLDLKVQKESNTNDILNELNNSLSILNDDNIVPLPDNFSIYGMIGQIHNRVVSNDCISVNTKKMIKEKLLTVVRMWIDRINKLEEVDERERIKIIKNIYSEINSFITTINNYLDSIIEASQYLSVIEGVSGPGSKKS